MYICHGQTVVISRNRQNQQCLGDKMQIQDHSNGLHASEKDEQLEVDEKFNTTIDDKHMLLSNTNRFPGSSLITQFSKK